MLIALLGIVKAGAAYLPLDAELPTSRLQYMIEDSGARMLVTTDRGDETVILSRSRRRRHPDR